MKEQKYAEVPPEVGRALWTMTDYVRASWKAARHGHIARESYCLGIAYGIAIALAELTGIDEDEAVAEATAVAEKLETIAKED